MTRILAKNPKTKQNCENTRGPPWRVCMQGQFLKWEPSQSPGSAPGPVHRGQSLTGLTK